ncbi:GAF and ANTAR domain-containing protein [Actinoplanes sp. URMC 104]|uniref:GAF and ANTAR domain-containing protein n=1 Tax=Actinoplanes sp. URMC 104 TaxID=3423409 RepID=UPI003F1A1099
MDRGRTGNGDRGRPSSSYTGEVPAQTLAQTLGELALSLQAEEDLGATLDAMVRAAVETIPGAQYAGLTVLRGTRTVDVRAASDELVHRVDRVQNETGQGPCLDAALQQQTVRVPDLAADDRWPDFTSTALAMGVRSVLSFQLYVLHDNLGALTLYATQPNAFDDQSEQVGLLFAAHAAVAMAGAQQRDDMNTAVATRDLIGQAKGILMERYRLTADQAFTLLVRASRNTNTKLTQVARTVAETGQFLERTVDAAPGTRHRSRRGSIPL